MNNLELKSIGVLELDTNEMVKIDGGNFIKWIFEIGAICDVVTDG